MIEHSSITVDQDTETGDVSVSIEYQTPDGTFGITMTLEEAAAHCYTLHQACRRGLAAQGELHEMDYVVLRGEPG